jgi:MFS family permease
MNKERKCMRDYFWRSPKRVYLLLVAGIALSQSVTFGTYVLFLQHVGLSPLQINLVNVAFYSSRVLLEVPTGAIADTFGRKASLVVAMLLYGAGLLVYWCATDMAWCVAAELVLAAGSTCASGSFEAWAVDEMHALDLHDEVTPMLAREHLVRSISLCVGAPVGGILATAWTPATPWLVAGIGSFAVAGAALLLMRETRVAVRTERVHRVLWNTTCESVRYALSPGRVRSLLLVGGLVIFGTMAPNMQWAQLFGPSVGGTLGAGFFFTGLVLCVALGALVTPHLVRWLGKERGLGTVLLASGVGLCLTVAFEFPFSLAPFVLYELANGAVKPLRSGLLNEAIESRDRATVLSCETMVAQLGGALGLVCTGAAAQYLGFQYAWALGGLALILAAVFTRRLRVGR